MHEQISRTFCFFFFFLFFFLPLFRLSLLFFFSPFLKYSPILSHISNNLSYLSIQSIQLMYIHIYKQGEVYIWGSNSHGQLGLGHNRHRNKPTKIKMLSTMQIVSIALGSLHSTCISDAGVAFSWGFGDIGGLGHGKYSVDSNGVSEWVSF